jgi:regulator of RNase E activity RraA
MVGPSKDREVFDTIRSKLDTALISDALDDLGAHEQVMRSNIRPVYAGAMVLGYAYPAITVEMYEVGDEGYPGMPETVDSLKPNDVLVLGGHRPSHACIWGDLVSVAAKARGANGAVIDGNTRDVHEITRLQFPVFSAGIGIATPLGRAKVSAHGCPVRCGGVLVNSGDIVFGDINGVVVIPRELVAQVIPLALKREKGEEMLRNRLLNGELMRSAQPKDSDSRWL